MIYLDYAANHPVRKEVLEEFIKVEERYYGNANSLHNLGKESLSFFEEMNSKFFKLLKLDPNKYEIIYTSSATESNNMVIKGIYSSYGGYSNLFLSSQFEHSSINSPLAYLKDLGANISLINTDKNGKCSIEDLKEKLKNKPILTCLCAVESEVGTIQDYKDFQKEINKSDGFLLLDATQAIGKINFEFNGYDFISFAPHKYGGIIGTGILIKRKDIVLTPLHHGGKSISLYRSSTPALGLIASSIKATEIALKEQEGNFNKVKELSDYLVNELKKIDNIRINSFLENPYIINISIKGKKAYESVEYLNKNGICVSQKSACSLINTPSKVINAIYHDKQRAMESFRISISELTKLDEIKTLIKTLGEYIKNA